MKHCPPYHWLEDSDVIGRIDLIDLFVKTGLCKSKAEARRLIVQGGLSFTCGKTSEDQYAILLYRGKKKVAMVLNWELYLDRIVYVSIGKYGDLKKGDKC